MARMDWIEASALSRFNSSLPPINRLKSVLAMHSAILAFFKS
jgi:hypothetical protein